MPMVNNVPILRGTVPRLGPLDCWELQHRNGVWEEVAFKHLRNRPALDDEPPAVLRDGCIDLLGLRENFL